MSSEVSAALLLVRLHDEGFVDMRDNTTSSNSGLDESVELFVTSDSEQQVSRCDSLNLKIFRGISSELKNLSSEVLKDSSAVDGRSSSYSRVGTDSALKESVDSSDGELKTSTSGSGHWDLL
jgi:hypothetical protein